MRLRTLIAVAAIVLALVAGSLAVGFDGDGVPTPPQTEGGR